MHFRKQVLVALLVLFPSLLLAQTGSISGVVTDPSGAVVQGAAVKAISAATGSTSSSQTGPSGAYSLPNLPVGNYTVTFEKQGFRVIRLADVVVSVALVLPLNAQFEVGTAEQTVTVSAETAAPIETETSQVSNLVDEQRLKALPLITRNPYELVLLSPGTAQSTGSGGFSVNGSRDRNNNFLLDGVDNNDTSVPGIAGGVLSANPENSEEFRVVTNNFNAEFGRNTGAIIDVVTKSGSNNFHGDAYWFGRYANFGGARDWFNPGSGPTAQPQNPYVRNQFGYSIGGPIWKNKTFFFFNQEFFRFPTAGTVSATVPNQAFTNGVFTWNGFEADGTPVSANIDLTPGSAQNQAFASLFGFSSAPQDPTLAAVFSKFPAAQFQNADGITGQAFFADSSNARGYAATAKIDHHFNDNEILSLRYGYDPSRDPSPFGDAIAPNNVGATSTAGVGQGVSASLNSTLRPTLLNNFTFGWNHISVDFACTGLNVLNSPFPVDNFGHGADFVLGAGTFTNFACANDTLLSDGQSRATSTTSYADTVTWVKHDHTWKFGGEGRIVHELGNSNFGQRRQIETAAGTLGVPLALLMGVNIPSDTITTSLDDAISAWFGLVVGDSQSGFFDQAGNRQGNDSKSYVQHEYGFYAQDTWKVRRNLTLNLGLRYQFNGVPFEKDGNLSNLYTDPQSFPVTFQLAGPNSGRLLYNNDFSNVEPRVGFSWDPRGDGRTAIRGGFGIFHDRSFGNLFGNSRGNPPFQDSYSANPFQTVNNAFPGNGNPVFPLLAPITNPGFSIPDGALAAPVIFPRNFRNPVLNSWFFGIQRELPGQIVADISYVGNSGVHNFIVVDPNPPTPGLVNDLVSFCSDPANAFGCTPGEVQGRLLYFGGDIGVFPHNGVAHNAIGRGSVFPAALNLSGGGSNYNSLQAKVTKRLTHGIQIQGAYTWSHSIDDANDPIVPGAGGVSFARNPYNPGQDRGNSDHDIRHVGVISYIWELPFGKGKSFANEGILGRALQGFEFSGITTFQSGRAFDVLDTTDSQRVGRVGRPGLSGDPFASGTNTPGVKVILSNPNAFTTPSFGLPGDLGRNFFHGPGFANFDLTLAKHTSLTERVSLETRFEVYNLFNHPNFQPPGFASAAENTVGLGAFGTTEAQVGRPDGTTGARQLQLGAKLTF